MSGYVPGRMSPYRKACPKLTGDPAGSVFPVLLTKVNVVSGAPWVTRMSTFCDVVTAPADSPRNVAVAADRKNRTFPTIELPLVNVIGDRDHVISFHCVRNVSSHAPTYGPTRQQNYFLIKISLYSAVCPS